MSTGRSFYPTPIIKLNDKDINRLYIKREDMIPYSFGGNKARKGLLFFDDIDKGDYDCVVTYGSSHSNHCRVIANMAAQRNMPCFIIGPEEVSDITYNSVMMDMLGAHITTVPVETVSKTIDDKINELKEQGKKPYFIAGGGHGNIGTQAYVDRYNEIKEYERSNNVFFDYIFFASGTGTTHAGLVCGQILNEDERKIIGISIARKNPRGREVVIDSIKEYLGRNDENIDENTVFIDDYTGDGYGKDNEEINQVIEYIFTDYGIPLDSTYTAKAFLGMKKYIDKHDIKDKNILFIHTGGTPLFFDDILKRKNS
jgi:D-cysteine desulfhydrase